MARGGPRLGSGRPKKIGTLEPEVLAAIKREVRQSPLEYMLAVLNDPEAAKDRRDRMAIAAAPYIHEKAADNPRGKKELADDAAMTAGAGTNWGSDLGPAPLHAN